MKKLVLAIVMGMMVTFSAGAFAEAAQMWRIAVTGVGGEDSGIVTVNEIQFFEAGAPTVNVTDLTVLRDSASTDELGTAIPPVVIVGRTGRPVDAAFDGNAGSKFRTTKAVGVTNTLYLQYTWNNSDQSRYPDVATYSITVDTVAQSPSTWTLQRNTGGQWVTVDTQTSVRFTEGEEKTFTVGQ